MNKYNNIKKNIKKDINLCLNYHLKFIKIKEFLINFKFFCNIYNKKDKKNFVIFFKIFWKLRQIFDIWEFSVMKVQTDTQNLIVFYKT